MSVLALGNERAQISDALPRIRSSDYRDWKPVGINHAVFGEQPDIADLLLFHAVQHRDALMLDIVAIVARAGKIVVFRLQMTGAAAPVLLPAAVGATDRAIGAHRWDRVSDPCNAALPRGHGCDLLLQIARRSYRLELCIFELRHCRLRPFEVSNLRGAQRAGEQKCSR